MGQGYRACSPPMRADRGRPSVGVYAIDDANSGLMARVLCWRRPAELKAQHLAEHVRSGLERFHPGQLFPERDGPSQRAVRLDGGDVEVKQASQFDATPVPPISVALVLD